MKTFHSLYLPSLALLLSACSAPSNVYVRKTPNTTPELRALNAQKAGEKPLNIEMSEDKLNPVTENQVLYLKEGQNKFLGDTQTNVTFLRTVSDSRCPENARCVQAGEAVVEIEFMQTTSRPMVVRLTSDEAGNRNGLKRSITVGDYTYTLEHLSPTISTERGFQQNSGKYFVGLFWQKKGNQPVQKLGTVNDR